MDTPAPTTATAPEEDASTAATDAAKPETPEPEKTEDASAGMNKALQKVQQDVSALTRFLDDLKSTSDEPTADELRAAETRRKKAVDSLRALDLNEAADELESLQIRGGRVDELAKQNAELAKQVAETQAAVNWMHTERQYPHTDVRKVWDKAWDDASDAAQKELEGVWSDLDEEKQVSAIRGKARTLFEERCKAVEAKAAAPKTPATPAKTGPTRTSPPSATGTKASIDPVTEQRQRALRLIRKLD